MPVSSASQCYEQWYLLRIWAEHSAESPHVVCRLSLEDVRTRERLGFGDPDRLLAFLGEQLDEIGRKPGEAFRRPGKPDDRARRPHRARGRRR